MKILFIVSVPIQEGSNLSLLNLIRALVAGGHKCALLATRQGFLIDEVRTLGVECKVIRYRASLYPTSNTLKDLLFYLPSLCLLYENVLHYSDVRRFVEEFSPDIIHTNVSTINIGYKVARELKIPHVWHIREYMDLDFHICPFPTMRSRKKQLADSYTICITKDIRRHFSLDDNPKSMVVYNGILNASDIYYTDEKEMVFLYAAFLQPCKGVYDLLDAYVNHLKARPESKYILRLLGGYQEQDYNKIQQFVTDNDIIDKVELMGRVSHDVVCANLRQASVTFIPSLFEGFGRTTAEAMFNGCLVAGRDTGGTKEQFDNGVAVAKDEIGIRFNTTDEMVAIMNDICDHGIHGYEEMIKRSQRVVKNMYSIESNRNSIINLYQRIIDEQN